MPFEITISRQFSAAHQLRLYDGSMEPLHGHNWEVKGTVQSENLDAIGVVMDFHRLEEMVDEILRPLHNGHLNQTEVFAEPEKGSSLALSQTSCFCRARVCRVSKTSGKSSFSNAR